MNFSKINIFNKRNYKMGDTDNTNFDIDLSKIDINNINELISDEELKKIMNEVEDISERECPMYSIGYCKNGSKCKFIHIKKEFFHKHQQI